MSKAEVSQVTKLGQTEPGFKTNLSAGSGFLVSNPTVDF